MNGLVTGAVTAAAALAVTMIAAASVYGLAPLPYGLSLLLAAEVGVGTACAIPAAVRHIGRTSRENSMTAECDVCGLPDLHAGQGDGIGSCDCPRCDGGEAADWSVFCTCPPDDDPLFAFQGG